MICDDVSFIREQQEVMFNKDIRSCFFGTPQYISRTEPEEASNLGVVVRNSAQDGIMTVPANGYGFSWMRVPCKFAINN
jgi:DNA helicase INO80